MENKLITILAIDDNQDNLLVLRVLLSDRFPKATLITSLSGKKGIELCRANKPDVVLLDIAMPGMDGYEVCQTLKEDDQLRHIPVVMLTATAVDSKSRILAMEAGADAFLSKPIDESELTAQIRAMLRIKESEDLKKSEKERLEILVQERTMELERELTERKRTETTLKQTVVKLEQSRLAESNLLADLRTEVAVRIQAENKVLNHLVDERIISEFSKALVRIKSKEEVYELIGRQIFEVAGDSIVLVVKSENETQSIKISNTYGIGNAIENIKKVTGFDALTLKVPLNKLSDKEKTLYYSKQLNQISENSLYTLSARTVNKKICKVIEKMLGITNVYTIGFSWGELLYGGVAVLCKNNCQLSQQNLVENLVNLSSVALQRLDAEEQIQKEHENLTAILSSSPVGMIVIDENEQIVIVNAAASRLFNKELEQMQKRGCGEFVGCINSLDNKLGCGYSLKCNACNILAAIRSALNEEQKIHDQEAQIVNECNGETTAIWIQFSIEPLLLNGKKHIVMSIHDNTSRKQAEDEKRQTEMRYRSLIEHAPDGIVMIGYDGKYKFASSSALRMFGYEEKDLQNSDPNESTHPEDLPRVLALLGDIIQNPTLVPTLEYRFRKMNGSWRWIQSTFSNLLSDPNVQAIVINFRDITERVEAEEAMRASEMKYRELFNANKDGISIFYINPDNKPGKFIEVNKAAVEMLGYSRDEFLNYTAMDLEVGAPHESLFHREEEIRRNGFASIETKLRHKNGTILDIELLVILVHYNNRLALMNIVRDITKRKEAEAALIASEHKYRKLHESMMDGFVFVDMDGKIKDCNESYIRMLGFTRDELSKLTYVDLTPEKWQSDEALIVDKQILTRGFSEIYEKEYIRKDGTVFPVELHAFLVKSDNDENEGIWAIVRDITQRKQDEAALRESRQQLLDIIDFLPDATFVIDNDKKVIAWNKAMEQMTGTNKRDMIGKGDHAYSIPFYGKRQRQLLDLIDIPDAELKARYNNFERRGDSICAEIFAPYLNDGKGAYISNIGAPLYNSEGKRIGSIESIRDITINKLAEAALKESEEKYRSMVDLLPDAVFIHDGENVLFANAASSRLLGVSFEDAKDVNILNFVHPDYKDSARKRVTKILSTGKPSTFSELKFIAVNGDIIDVESIGIPVTYNGKKAVQTIARDFTERKKAEREIRVKDELLHLTGEMAKVGGWEFDAETKQGTWTREVARIHDMDPNTATDVEIGTSFYSGESLAKLNNATAYAIKNGTPYDLELQMTSAKGTKKWVRTMGIPVMDGNKVLKVRGIYQDITTRKEAEIILENERLRLRTLIATIPDVIWLKDPDGKYLLCNPVFEYFYGLKESLILGKTDFDFEPQEVAEVYRRQDQLVFENDSPIIHEEWIKCRANGQQRLMETIKTPMYDSEMHLIGVLGVARDITEVHQSHESLRKSEANIRSLIENTDESIWSIDADFNLIDANVHFIKNIKLGTGKDILPGDNVLEILPDKLKKEWQVYYARALSGESFTVETSTITHFEKQIMEYSLNPIVTSDNRLIGASAFGHNITAIKKAQQEISILNTELENRVNQRTYQLEQANKELEAFSYSVSHDLRAPLRGIDGWSLALLEDNGDQLDEKGHVYLDRVRSEAQRMGHLIDDLLKLSRVSRFEMKQNEVNLTQLAETIVGRLTEANKDRNIEFTIKPALQATGDPAMLEIVLTNLLDNACKFTGKLPLAIIEFGMMEAEGRPIYYIRDNGVGFDMENAKNLFSAFQRMHKQTEFQGTGVGLATVQRIIHRHGGRIWAESRTNEGAIFYFTINVMQ